MQPFSSAEAPAAIALPVVPRVLSFSFSPAFLCHKEAFTEERVLESNHPGDGPKVFFFYILVIVACNKLQIVCLLFSF